ncbi:phosphotransferase [Arthrobacter sp. NPDC056691]|uniref:phosphotransferase n=1 Tax=Arthrobacter sp. NPDC056691 TaxID=3345913 RepID=UPI003672CF6B
MNKIAIIVEDDIQQIYFTRGILAEHGFDVTSFGHASEAVLGIASVNRPIDLVILDRKLPQEETDEPNDAVGDVLLGQFLAELPDTVFVVFTGYTDIFHQQFATRERGTISIGSTSFDRVCAYEKGQAVEFDEYVKRLSQEIDSLGDLEVIGFVEDDADLTISRRLLRLVAHHYGGDSISVRALTDGKTDLPVWHCRIRDASGNEVASVVVKQTDGSKAPPASGLHTILPAGVVAAPVALISGLCDGKRAQVMQVAGPAPTSLLKLLDENQASAAQHLSVITDAIQSIPVGGSCTKNLEDLVQPLLSWPKLLELSEMHGILPPRREKRASTRIGAQHGDLHPGNILEAENAPVLIDFDNEVFASRLLDPITVLLSPLFHPDSPIRKSQWPTPEQCAEIYTDAFLEGSPCREWTAAAQRWVEQALTSENERWALTLAYAMRQLKYDDVLDNPQVKRRAIALARKAASALES